MDRDKLNKAADGLADKYGFNALDKDSVRFGFKNGAKWLMRQSLSERLTDEEKEKLTPANRYILGTIFGTDLFK